MANGAEKRIYWLAVMCGVFAALAFIVPRFVPSYRDISLLPKLAGIGPSVVAVAALVWLLGFLRY